MGAFALHPQLAADTIEVGNHALCKVLLMNDSQYPWLILVPQRPDIREVYQLTANDQQRLWQEVSQSGKALMDLHKGFKLNIGALGNMVPQLHIHVIARQTDDAAWTGPVWGVKPAQAYKETTLTAELTALKAAVFN